MNQATEHGAPRDHHSFKTSSESSACPRVSTSWDSHNDLLKRWHAPPASPEPSRCRPGSRERWLPADSGPHQMGAQPVHLATDADHHGVTLEDLR